jgi:tetratricopeptide (TPR) repeat protein
LLLAHRESPDTVTIYVSLTMLYAGTGRFEQALQALEQARVADPIWPTLSALKIFVYFAARDFNAAISSWTEALDLYPYLHLGRAYYAQALEYSGRVDEALNQYTTTCTFAPDVPWLRALEASCLARHGRRPEAEVFLEKLEVFRQSDYVDAYYMAVLREALSDRSGALLELERAVEENSATLFILDVDPKMDPLRSEPRFAAIRDRLFAKSIETAAY